MGINQLTGSPWHAERVHRKDGDSRRYKGRCKYYNYKNNYCSHRCGKCIGSAHFSGYMAISDDDFKKRQRNKSRKNSGDDEIYWY